MAALFSCYQPCTFIHKRSSPEKSGAKLPVYSAALPFVIGNASLTKKKSAITGKPKGALERFRRVEQVICRCHHASKPSFRAYTDGKRTKKAVFNKKKVFCFPTHRKWPKSSFSGGRIPIPWRPQCGKDRGDSYFCESQICGYIFIVSQICEVVLYTDGHFLHWCGIGYWWSRRAGRQ